jgi:hypothetical protein
MRHEKKMTLIERWLVAATHGLSAESAAQVRAEIHEHYQSAHEAALAVGLPSQEADLTAVTALGEARSANRQYRRVLLTSREANLLHLMTFNPSSLPPRRVTAGKWLAGLLQAEATAGLILLVWKDHALLYLGAVLVAVLLSRWLPVDTLPRGRNYRWAKWTALTGGAALTGWYGTPWAPLAALCVSAYSDYLRMSIRRKLPIDQWPKALYR